MIFKKMLSVLLVFAMLAVSSVAFADTVYVTKSGKKYHKAECRLIQNKETTAMDQKEAEEKGYTPCKKCHKEKTESSK